MVPFMLHLRDQAEARLFLAASLPFPASPTFPQIPPESTCPARHLYTSPLLLGNGPKTWGWLTFVKAKRRAWKRPAVTMKPLAAGGTWSCPIEHLCRRLLVPGGSAKATSQETEAYTTNSRRCYFTNHAVNLRYEFTYLKGRQLAVCLICPLCS